MKHKPVKLGQKVFAGKKITINYSCALSMYITQENSKQRWSTEKHMNAAVSFH
jgi:hypothetical protein